MQTKMYLGYEDQSGLCRADKMWRHGTGAGRRVLLTAHASEAVDLNRRAPDRERRCRVSLTELIRAAAAPSTRSRFGSGPAGMTLVRRSNIRLDTWGRISW
jgi:hypothetical protein